ncbi:hypothetical protein OEZ85_005745 [Tetradesmus obliquus]|uniref:Senescence domain-containing protein n=1 Tax=Tetradesmus obliquus TaxID=3088 RepID=A0ABY8UEQ9_TETOB|nr:hypothetical protein OEZ85_005745 [Tetradesmus obliquus]
MSSSSGPPTQLVLAVHTVEAATAKVPFAMILLLDFAKRKATPPGCKCRMVIPSDGITSVSLWDTADPASLQEWLAENLGSDCRSELHEVQEDFTWGMSLELARMRATEKVTDGSMKTIGALGERTSRAAEVVAAGLTTAVGSTQQKLEAWDQRTGVLTSAKETTAALQQRVIGAMAKAAENERVHSVVSNVSTGVSSSWAKVSSWVGQRLGDMNVNDGADEYGPQAGGAGAYTPNSYSAAPQQQQQQQQYSSPQHTLSSSTGGGTERADSTDRPLTFTDSMLADPLGSPDSSKAAAAAGGSPPKAADS